MKGINYHIDTNGLLTIEMDTKGSKTNTMNAEFRSDMTELVKKIEQDRSLIKGIIFSSAKDTFFAGGDLNELIEVKAEDASDFFNMISAIKNQFRTIETLGVPVVAALGGSALGGGLELALACHHRICIDSNKTKLGFPEVTLGLLPGAGGVVRTTRLVGLEKAFPLLIEGKQLRPKEALAAGIVDALATDSEDLMTQAKNWISNHPESSQAWDQKKYKVLGGGVNHPKIAQMLSIAPAMIKQKSRGCYPAPMAILSAAVEGLQVNFDTAQKIESRYFTKLAQGQIAKNMMGTFWFQMNDIKKGKSRPKGIAPKTAKKVGIIGAGMMGAGIAYAVANRGLQVVLKDENLAKAEKGKSYSEKLLDKKLAKNYISLEQKQTCLDLIKSVDQYEDFAECDLVIEAVFEDRLIKKNVTNEAAIKMPETSIFASNTSTLPISGLAKNYKKPENFIGIHFFSPVEKMQLVEIIVGSQTSPDTLAAAYDFVMQIGKVPIVVNDSRGFFTSRVFGTYVNEGMAMLAEGQDPQTIERAAYWSGFPVGPLAVSDEVSLSLMDLIIKQTKKDLEQEHMSYKPHPADQVVELMNSIKRLGKASGQGFYNYSEGQKEIWDGIQEHFPKQQAIALKDMQDRLLYIQAIESVRCLEENVLLNTGDANIGTIFGLGYPAWTGGAIQYINHIGCKNFCLRAQELAKAYGDRFNPPNLLVEKAERNASF